MVPVPNFTPISGGIKKSLIYRMLYGILKEMVEPVQGIAYMAAI